MKTRILPLALLLAASPLSAQQPAQPSAHSPSQPRDPENYEPWLAEQGIRPGDKWARVLLDLDARGRPLRCRIAATNIRNRTQRFYFCNAFMGGAFQTEPVRENGVAVPGTIERVLVMPGRNSRGAHERARREQRARDRQRD